MAVSSLLPLPSATHLIHQRKHIVDAMGAVHGNVGEDVADQLLLPSGIKRLQQRGEGDHERGSMKESTGFCVHDPGPVRSNAQNTIQRIR